MRPPRAFVTALVVAVALAGCSGSEREPTASAGIPLEIINGEPCPLAGPSLPPTAGCETSVAGDFDGDGGDDRATVYAELDDDLSPVSWWLRVITDSGEQADRRLDAGTRFSYPRAVGRADVQGDGSDELFVKVGDQLYHSGATRVLNMFVLDGDEVVPVTGDGAPLALRVGGIWRFAEGVECRRGRMVLLRAETRNTTNTRWWFSERFYVLEGSRTKLKERREDVFRIPQYYDPLLDRFFELNCGDLSFRS
jgi:hypothetical protein